MSRDPNPLDDGDDINPFSADAIGSKSQLPPMQSDPNRHDATDDVPLDNVEDPKKKEKDIAAWEADLKRREQEIKRREDALANTGFIIKEKNWPLFFPIIHHDIAKEIPVNAQGIQYLAFASWLGIILCLAWNFVAAIAIASKEEVHIGFCIVATIAPPILFEGKSLTGFLATFDAFSASGLVGIFCLVGSCLFCLETLLSALVLQRIYMYFRGEK